MSNSSIPQPTSSTTSTAQLRVGEVVSTASPKVDLGPAKAIAATVGGALVAGLGALGTALADERVTYGEWVAVAIALIVGSGIVGAGTYLVPTTVKRNA